jgi:hypothetical protein
MTQRQQAQPQPKTKEEYETVREVTHRFGNTGFLEVARKRLVVRPDAPPADEFLMVTRGFFTADGSRRWTRFVTLPDNPDAISWLAEALRET